MNITSDKTDQIDVPYSKEAVADISEAANEQNHHLCLFLGLYLPNKKEALKAISDNSERSVHLFDLNDFVVKSEAETRENLQTLFNKYESTDSILYFENGDKLCGAYTGFSHSRVKYASPQERYFLSLIQDFNGLVIVDISEYSAADKSIRRAAQSIVRFDLPNSILQRFMWHLKNYTLHGFQLKTKRPDSYGEVPGNF